RVTGEEAQVLMQELAQNVQQKVIKQQKEISTKNAEESEAFLAANKEKEGVKTTESGLQYLVLSEGDGPTPTAASRVKVHYSGTLIDGTEFDSSYKRGQPAVFPVGAVIKGWTEALQMMKVGSKYKLFIPSNLAYGKQGAGAIVGPNAVLIFEVELLGIEE
ncbi:MAG: FKBP-type peptidyl-prolyl cis-trans isomerase, partial [Candidatus Omnitrophica bacterium]|nr:FKBP-type peptidyl-prolyl cis-trans isomerase [Candidatus Omnitrophota bacterium]